MPEPDDLAAMAREVIDSNHYMTLGTVDPGGLARLSPVYFTHVDHARFFWISSPEAHHSRNLSGGGDVSIVIYDSSAPVGQGKAVYVTAVAGEVPERALAEECRAAFRSIRAGGRSFAPDELSGAAPLRLYRADARRHEVHIAGRDPVYGTGVDTRREVLLP